MQLARAIRKAPVQTQVLLGGVDKRAEGKADASLYWMDYLGTLQKVSLHENTCFLGSKKFTWRRVLWLTVDV